MVSTVAEVSAVVQAISRTAQPLASKAWTIVYRQQEITAWVDIVVGLGLDAIAYLGLKWAVGKFAQHARDVQAFHDDKRNNPSMSYFDCPEDSILPYFAIVGSAMAAIPGIILCVNGIQLFLNPAYYTLQALLGR